MTSILIECGAIVIIFLLAILLGFQIQINVLSRSLDELTAKLKKAGIAV